MPNGQIPEGKPGEPTERIVIIRSVMDAKDWGIYALAFMRICGRDDASNEEILKHCNLYNICGTTGGWSKVWRKGDKHDTIPNMEPVTCQDFPDRTHFMVSC